GRWAPPSRREMQWLVGAIALLALVTGLVAVGERTVWGDALFVALNYGAYNATFFNAHSYLPHNMGTTFFTGTPNWLPRAGSLAVNPLDLATLLLIALPIVLAAMPVLKERIPRVWRLLMQLALVTSGAAIVLAFSRTNLLMLPVELLLLMLLLGIRRQWSGVLLVSLGVGIGISLFWQTSVYVLSVKDGSDRVARSTQGLLAPGAYTWLDLLAPVLTTCGIAAIVAALIVGASAMRRHRRDSLARATFGGLVGVALVAACLFVPPLAAANTTGMFASLIYDTPIATLVSVPSSSTNPTGTPRGGTSFNLGSGTSPKGVVSNTLNSDNTSTQGHLESYKRLPGVILHHPLGYGIGSAGRVGSRFNTGLNAESAYLPVGVELGLPGLLLYLGIFLVSLFAVWNATRSRLDLLYRVVFAGTLAAWVFVLVDGVVTEVTLNFFVLYVMFWLTGSAVTLTRQSRVVTAGSGDTFAAVRPLRIAMDVQCLRTTSTGVRVYVNELLARFEQRDAPHVVVPISGPNGLPRTNKAFRAVNQCLNLLWVHVLLPIRVALGNYDVLFSPEYLTPLWAPVARVVTFHDSAFLRRPQDYNRIWRWMFRLITIPATRHAEAVVTPSRYTATEAVQRAHFDPSRIYVTPLGLPASARLTAGTQADQVLARFGVVPGGYLLHVGVLEHRKNLETLVRGFALWRQQGGPQHFKLVLVGHSPVQPTLDDTPNLRRVISELGLDHLVVLTGRLALEERDALYARAAAYVLPSKSEGFGIPVLEAFAARIPVVSSNVGALPEVAGDAALFFNPSSPQELADRLKQLADDPRLRSELVRRGSERLTYFTWDRTAQQTYGAFEAAAVRAYAPSRASDAAPSYTIDKE
ncbi:MAG TPA: glycosyltransferase family 1 protein, partial [Ktedonobacterales bacterium]|nr:glycosyltransferase family 1 protein [Ktedonobacterales bacterium]